MSDEADADRKFWEEPEDPWPDEPEEFDPSSLGPEVPEAPDPASGEVTPSPELVQSFWAAVIYANIGLLGVSLGPMLIYFEGDVDLGLPVFFIGVIALLFCYRQYYSYVNRDDADGPDGPDDPDDADTAGDERGATGERGAPGSGGGD